MKKIALHWQILIALLLAILYGIIFPTRYILQDKKIDLLVRQEIPAPVLHSLQSLTGKSYTTLEDFQKTVRSVLNESDFNSWFLLIKETAYENPAVNAVSWMGDIFLRGLKMLIIPLIISSLITGITNIGSGQNLGRLGLKTMSYYLLTSTFAILTGLFLVNLIQPGKGTDMNFIQKVDGLADKQRGLKELVVEIVPENVFQSIVESDMLPVIFFSILFGFFITKTKRESADFMKNIFNSLFDVMMKITLFIIRFTPLGIFGIVAKVVADQDDLGNLISRMGIYMGTVILALVIHAFVSLPLIVRFIGKSRPFRHFRNMTTPLLTAFSTSSSGATLPLTITAVEQESGVSNKITSFTLPLGATINMDGTALYECVAALFIAQAYGVDLTILQQVIVVITALLASIGAAGIPMAGLVMITVILTAVNLPLEGVGLILAVDRILDMFRTATNVWSDSCGAVVIAKSEGETLKV